MADFHPRGACKQVNFKMHTFCVPLRLLCCRHSNTKRKVGKSDLNQQCGFAMCRSLCLCLWPLMATSASSLRAGGFLSGWLLEMQPAAATLCYKVV